MSADREQRLYSIALYVDAGEAKTPKIHKVIEPEDIKAKTNLTAPHTVH